MNTSTDVPDSPVGLMPKKSFPTCFQCWLMVTRARSPPMNSSTKCLQGKIAEQWYNREKAYGKEEMSAPITCQSSKWWHSSVVPLIEKSVAKRYSSQSLLRYRW